ncbi:hypothetical protein [Acinetobacter radioresistens]|uniref:hypothetical protein n=1 Tax=Acinetobacter radioresistens TaxID=40216 RepID=UPI003213B5BF
MNFRDFILKQSPEDLEKYAKNAGTTVGYLKSHLLYGYKEPRKHLRKSLAVASNGQVTEMEILQHFGLFPAQQGNSSNINKFTI